MYLIMHMTDHAITLTEYSKTRHMRGFHKFFFDKGFTMGVYDKIYLEAYINNQYIWLKIILHNYISH